MQVFKKCIKEYDDFPIKGVKYLDLNPLYQDNKCIDDMTDRIVERLLECNFMCGINDLSPRSQTELDLNWE